MKEETFIQKYKRSVLTIITIFQKFTKLRIDKVLGTYYLPKLNHEVIDSK